MANSILSYTDAQIMKALLTHNFSEIGGRFEDDVIEAIKGGAFYDATNLTEVILPSVTVVHPQAFMGASGIQTIDLTWSEITSIGAQAFYNGWNGLPASITLSKLTTLGRAAFAGTSSAKNTKLTSISLPLWTGAAPNAGGFSEGSAGAFEYCSALTSVNVPEVVNLAYQTFRYCNNLVTISLPKATTIGSNTFAGCSKLEKIKIGGDIKSLSSSFLPTTTTGTTVLEAFILSGVTTVPTLDSNFFTRTNIANGTAYIYVPSSLLSIFQVATNWSTYEAQIRSCEDYPSVCNF